MKTIFKRPVFWVLLGLLLAGWLVTRTLYPGNVAQTSSSPDDPQLRTRMYRVAGGVTAARAQIVATIPTLTTYGRHWRVIAETSTPLSIRAEVPVFFFTDDVQIDLRTGLAAEEIIVDARSASRVGKSDFGENRRHLRALLTALDDKLK